MAIDCRIVDDLACRPDDPGRARSVSAEPLCGFKGRLKVWIYTRRKVRGPTWLSAYRGQHWRIAIPSSSATYDRGGRRFGNDVAQACLQTCRGSVFSSFPLPLHAFCQVTGGPGIRREGADTPLSDLANVAAVQQNGIRLFASVRRFRRRVEKGVEQGKRRCYCEMQGVEPVVWPLSPKPRFYDGPFSDAKFPNQIQARAGVLDRVAVLGDPRFDVAWFQIERDAQYAGPDVLG